MSTTSRPVTYSYISPGVIKVTDTNGGSTQISFTSTGQIQSIQDALNRVTQFSYDANDYLSQITAPGNSISKFSYDAQGRLLSQTDPLNQTVTFTYTGNLDSPTSVRDQKEQVTQYSYNIYGELTGITYANGSSETFSYDLSGNLFQAKERSGDTFQFTYDTTGKLTRKTFDDGTFESYAYDTKGNLSSITKGSETISLEYDTNNRLTKITYPNGRWLQYTYDSTGKRTKMVDQAGFTVNYNYDADDRLVGLTNASGQSLITYTYDAVGRLSRETNGNGTYTIYKYDAASQLTEISNHAANSTVNSYFRYTYDNLGRQTSVTTAEGKWTYEYDGTGQLTRAFLDYTDPSLTDQDLRYVYDAAGNRISSSVNGVTTNYTANNLNQYTQVGSATYTYDADGNLIKVVDGGQTWNYVYNDENRLISATTPQGTFTYEYNALGDRTAVMYNGQRTEYLVDPFGWGNVNGEYNGSGALIANYTHGIGLVGRFSNGDVAHYYDFDAIGSTVGLTGASGSYVNRYSYRPFGETLTTTEAVANPFEYVGQWGVMDEASGLDFMRARYYSPSLGRFTSSDPLGQEGGWNIYAYALNNPISYTDPTGEVPWIVAPVLGGVISGGINLGSQLIQNGGNWSQVNWGSVGTDFAVGAALGSLGPSGIVFGRGGAKAAQFGYKEGIFNTGNFRVGWSWNKGRNWFSIHGGKPYTSGHWHRDLLPGPKGDGVIPFGLGGGLLGGLWRQARNAISPLVFDLDNDGIELISLQNSATFFDLDADGFAERTGWVKADDGILAWDKNGDGEINDITELFGNETTDGFIILKQLDSNNDGIIDSKDTQFNNLRVWRDKNQDGFSDIGELRSLNDWNIHSINLNYQAVNLTNEGNRISSTSTYTLANGTTRQIVDVWFTLDQVTSYYSKDYQIKAETLFLPTLRGYGNLPDLYIAMSKDSTLLGMMRNLVLLETSNYEQFYSQFLTQVEALFYRWAGVQNIAANSRGAYIDGRKLGFLEIFFGEGFLQGGWGANPGPQASNILLGIWNNLFREFSGRLLVQGSLRDLFSNTTYNLANDSLESNTDLNTVLNHLITNVPTNGDQAIIYWSLIIAGLDAYENRFGLSQTDYDQRINQALASSQLSGYLNALRQPNFLGIADDVISGTSGNDIINGYALVASFLTKE
ncbi:RHS repeat protein [Nostoc sp. FACHB-110]|uniref:RHS repeat protein n=1 Tax=Nostoc sp. FACHB-110 TaxID=2692834 RepID=UPI0016883019|nr:RHS repeat protein [Nostoc sp. FACHB-110]MBD2438866.1 RHS repeat protein [Nostoc sp. FACHB-110]